MPTDNRSPTTNATIVKGWLYPISAYADDALRTYSSTFPSLQEYGGYGFTVPSSDTLSEVLLKVKGYLNDPTVEELWAYWYDGATWYYTVIPLTTSEQTYSKNITAQIDTPAKLNAIKTRIQRKTIGSGCFPSECEFLCHDGENFKQVKVSDLTLNDELCGITARNVFKRARITEINMHHGTWDIIRAFVTYPKTYVNATYENIKFRQLFKLERNKDFQCDIAVTDNHPIFTRNKGHIPARELQIGDILAEFFFDANRLQAGAVQVEDIERFVYEGTVYDIQGESDFIFGKYLLGYDTKIPY